MFISTAYTCCEALDMCLALIWEPTLMGLEFQLTHYAVDFPLEGNGNDNSREDSKASLRREF